MDQRKILIVLIIVFLLAVSFISLAFIGLERQEFELVVEAISEAMFNFGILVAGIMFAIDRLIKLWNGEK